MPDNNTYFYHLRIPIIVYLPNYKQYKDNVKLFTRKAKVYKTIMTTFINSEANYNKILKSQEHPKR